MVGKIINLISRALAWVKKNRRIKPKGDVIKVNLGCGYRVVDGWINVDGGISPLISKLPKPLIKLSYKIYKNSPDFKYEESEFIRTLKKHDFIHHNFVYGVPFADESVDYFFSAHMLEHLYRWDAEKLLKDIHRALKKGGLVRICVPDLDYALNLFKKGKKEEAYSYFFRSSRHWNKMDEHRYMYDFEELKKLLKSAGFKKISQKQYREGSLPDLQDIDVRPRNSIYAEAIK